MKLPLFPLPTLLLPDGIMPLRIFESRYVRMLTLCSENGFVLCMLNPSAQQQRYNMYPFATRVQMIDFTTLPDGLLGITVKGIEVVEILHVHQDDDGLRFGEVAFLAVWPQRLMQDQEQHLAERLQEVFTQFPEFAALYPQPIWHDACWVARRWLEVLPIDPDQKQDLISQSDCQPALDFVHKLLLSEQFE